MDTECSNPRPDTNIACPAWCSPADCWGYDAEERSTVHVRYWYLAGRPDVPVASLMQIMLEDGTVTETSLRIAHELEFLTAAECREIAGLFEDAAGVVDTLEGAQR